MSRRYRGRSYQNILRKLPRNLVVFDGHCLMCQARVQYVLERNFSYFSFLRLTQGVDPVRLARNKMLFCSFDSVNWRELRRNFPHLLSDADAVALIEKVPSQTASFLSRVRQRQERRRPQGPSGDARSRGHHTGGGGGVFAAHSPLAPLASSTPSAASGVADGLDAGEEDVDILVSVKYEAVCRIGMKLDRWLPRTLFCCLYYTLPQRLGDRWYDHVLRRRQLWGTSEEDAVRYPKRVLGLKERTWRP
ncbi:uncharacterized protein Tco025E_02531 [Trypanosoma conorhini]|uniref:DUF393 domain-containing protein n=1 Tax=Trypanosoma conorhini TaxID=83891 RepID=A0A3R7PFB9_9TRYP|nr:uncharacterized protein Tco025E_02531 [Trypanosoma conorhini]RNF24468.1 hypothetical protein Tco025E_02531 [Trypanosoma conorhini]